MKAMEERWKRDGREMEERERGWTEEGRKEGTTEKERSGGKSDSSGLDFCEGPIRGRGYSIILCTEDAQQDSRENLWIKKDREIK